LKSLGKTTGATLACSDSSVSPVAGSASDLRSLFIVPGTSQFPGAHGGVCRLYRV